MAKTFMGGVRLAVAKAGSFIELKPGGDYDAQGEVTELVNDLLEAAKTHKLRISAFMPEAEGGKKVDYATTWSPVQIAKALETRVPVVMQSQRARFPAPYLALMLPRAEEPKAKAAGPDLTRKAAGPDLTRKAAK